MFEPLVRMIIEHPRRRMIVTTLTLGTGVVLGLPAVEEYSAALERSSAAREQLAELSTHAANLPQVSQALAKKKRELADLESKRVSDQDIEGVRDELQRLIREAGCEMREVKIEDLPMRRGWLSDDSPLRSGGPVGTGQETPFDLVQWKGLIRIEGTMGAVYRFLGRLGQLDRFVRTGQTEIRRSDVNDELTQLKMELTLYDLPRKKSAKPGA